MNPFIETVVTKTAFGTPFSANIGNARRYLGMLQKDLSEKLKVSQSSIVNWESGSTTPHLPKFVELCEVLKVTPNKLLGLGE